MRTTERAGTNKLCTHKRGVGGLVGRCVGGECVFCCNYCAMMVYCLMVILGGLVVAGKEVSPPLKEMCLSRSADRARVGTLGCLRTVYNSVCKIYIYIYIYIHNIMLVYHA